MSSGPDYTPEQEAAERRQNDPDFYSCPQCGAAEPDVECGKSQGFAGPIYFANYKCCGFQDVDDSEDNLDAAR